MNQKGKMLSSSWKSPRTLNSMKKEKSRNPPPINTITAHKSNSNDYFIANEGEPDGEVMNSSRTNQTEKKGKARYAQL